MMVRPSETMSADRPSGMKIGQRIEFNGHYGTVLYIGEVPPTEGIWLGIDWDDPKRGKHNGTYEGMTYFKTRYPTSGSFIRLGKVNFGEDCVSAIQSRYGEVKDDDTAGIDKKQMALVQKEIHAPFFEVVGFSKVNKQQSDFGNLAVVFLKEHFVNGAGPANELHKLCPKVSELDLSRNLLSSWEVVAEIAQQLPDLRVLTVSENRFPEPNDPGMLSDSFKVLEHLVAGRMEYTWSDILECAKMWPNLHTLQVPFNRITSLDIPDSNFLQKVKSLDLEGNQIGDWKEVNKLGMLQSLETLNLANIGITEIQFPTDEPTQKTDLFPSLKLLYISNNNISEWISISELDKLRNLVDIRFHYNPIVEKTNEETSRQLIIARIANLKKLNGALILPEERKGAEYDYLKMHGQSWLEIDGKEDRDRLVKEFLLNHPRYTSLIQKFGVLEEGEVKDIPKTLKTKLITVEISSPKIPEKVFKKKLSLNMSVQKLVGLVQKLFNIGYEIPHVTYISSKNPTLEVVLDNPMKEIDFYSIEDGDCIIVNWS